jgi:hypothetical protein
LGARYPDDSFDHIPKRFDWVDYRAYLTALRGTSDRFSLAVRSAERALYALGRTVGTDEGRSWGEYRTHLKEALSP